jgi:hypothetical protein
MIDTVWIVTHPGEGAAVGVSGFRASVCPTCHAIVPMENADDHERWHQELLEPHLDNWHRKEEE